MASPSQRLTQTQNQDGRASSLNCRGHSWSGQPSTPDGLAPCGVLNLSVLLVRKMLWKREVFWTDLLPIFSWSTFQRLRVIWKKIRKTQAGCSPQIHSFTVSGERCVHWLSRQWGGHPSGGGVTGRWAGHFSGIRSAVGKGCWAM